MVPLFSPSELLYSFRSGGFCRSRLRIRLKAQRSLVERFRIHESRLKLTIYGRGKKTDVGTVGFNTFNGYLYALYQFTTGACANPCIEKLMKYTDRTFPSSHCHSLRSNCTLLSFYLSFPSAFCFTKLIKMRPVSLPFFLCVFFFYVALQACRE